MLKKVSLIGMAALLLSGCNTTEDSSKLDLSLSYLKEQKKQRELVDNATGRNETSIKVRGVDVRQPQFENISAAKWQEPNNKLAVNTLIQFSNEKTVKLASDSLIVKDFLHYIYGEVLGVSYVLDQASASDKQVITLNLQKEITHRELFLLSEKLLKERGYELRISNNIFYIGKADGSSGQGNIAYGYGTHESNVPSTNLPIVQIIPLKFGMQTSLANTIQRISGVQTSPDFENNKLIMRGNRVSILKALEFIEMVDKPMFLNKEAGLYKTQFATAVELQEEVIDILKQEGLTVSAKGFNDKAVSVIAIERLSSVLFFANDKRVLDRVHFWFEKLDQPGSGNDTDYYFYQPSFARASDLMDSLQGLISGRQTSVSSKTSAASENRQETSNNASTGLSNASGDGINLVVDSRANALIFKTTGDKYRKLLPLIKKLDTLPRQVILEVMIAEVTMTDEFKQGVEFAFNDGKYAVSTKGAFLGEGFGGLSYLLKGSNGELLVNLLQTNSLVNVLSKPSLVVRDGVSASINVGTDIPIIGSTTTDPIGGERQTTQIEYRKTGVQLSVKPTINARGVVIMEIKQKISNEVDVGGTQNTNPSLFERSIDTEVVAQNGQTIVLGGLISDNSTLKTSRVPLLSDIPIIGGLFGGETKGGDKTELIVLVTPKIIDDTTQWQEIKASLQDNFVNFTFN